MTESLNDIVYLISVWYLNIKICIFVSYFISQIWSTGGPKSSIFDTRKATLVLFDNDIEMLYWRFFIFFSPILEIHCRVQNTDGLRWIQGRSRNPSHLRSDGFFGIDIDAMPIRSSPIISWILFQIFLFLRRDGSWSRDWLGLISMQCQYGLFPFVLISHCSLSQAMSIPFGIR